MKTNYFIKNLSPLNIAYNNNINYLFTTNLVYALQKKKIIVSNINFSKTNNLMNIELVIFYRKNKLKYYKNKIRKLKKTKIKSNNKLINLFENKNVKIKIKNLNKFINMMHYQTLFLEFQYYSKKILGKRIFLYIDFLKILLLVEKKKASVWTLTYILASIFKPLRKHQHGTFFTFLDQIFKYLLKKRNSNIEGIKIILNGRVKGKTRAKFIKLTLGKISLTHQNANVQATQQHIYTIYGCFGLKLWIKFKK